MVKAVPTLLHYTLAPERLADASSNRFYQLIEKGLCNLAALSPAQYDLLDNIGGFNEVKTPRELRNILLDMEEAYSPGINVACSRF